MLVQGRFAQVAINQQRRQARLRIGAGERKGRRGLAFTRCGRGHKDHTSQTWLLIRPARGAPTQSLVDREADLAHRLRIHRQWRSKQQIRQAQGTPRLGLARDSEDAAGFEHVLQLLGGDNAAHQVLIDKGETDAESQSNNAGKAQ